MNHKLAYFLLVTHCSYALNGALPTLPLWYFSPSPENCIGSLTSSLPIQMVEGSKFMIKVNARGDHDHFIVNNRFQIESGATVEVLPFPERFPRSQCHTILTTTQPIEGQFDRVVIGNCGHFQGCLVYEPQAVRLILEPLYYSYKIQGGNAGYMAAYLDDASMYTYDFHPLFCKLDRLDCKQLEATLNQIQPSHTAGFALAKENTHFVARSALTHRLQEVYTNTCFSPSRYSVWVEPFGKFARQGDLTNEPGYNQNTGGAMLGFDVHPSNDFLAGVALGGSDTQLKWGQDKGNGSIQNMYGALYGSFLKPRYAIDASFLGGYGRNHGTRPLPILNRQATHHHTSYEWGAQLGFNLFFPTSIGQLQPVARVEYLSLTQKAFKEKGAECLGFKIRKKHFSLIRTEVGVIGSRCLQLQGDYQIIPELGLSWIYENRLNDPWLKARFSNSDKRFKVLVLNPNRNLVSPTLALTAFYNKKFTTSLRFTGEYGSHLNENVISGQLNYNF